MKRIIFIIVVCVFAVVSSSFAQNEVIYDIYPSQNQQYGVFIGGAVYMQTYMIKDQYANVYGCNVQVYNSYNQSIASIIWGPYNGPEYADGSTYNYQSMYLSEVYALWIRSHNAYGVVAFYW